MNDDMHINHQVMKDFSGDIHLLSFWSIIIQICTIFFISKIRRFIHTRQGCPGTIRMFLQ